MKPLFLLALAAIGCGSHSAAIPTKLWPWTDAQVSHPWRGVSHWIERDGALSLDLFDFDFQANPALRFGLYDVDQDDKAPYDDKVDYPIEGISSVARHIQQRDRSKVLAAWNGPFFFFDPQSEHETVRHIGPIVTDGKPHYNVGDYRWTFGVKERARNSPEFSLQFKPSFGSLAGKFTFAASGLQCLIRDGEPLLLKAADSDKSVGRIKEIDEMTTSRTSMGWSKDSKHLYLLTVTSPDVPGIGKPNIGWTLAQLQQFWVSFGAWAAVNSDGGPSTCLLDIQADGSYDLIPSGYATERTRKTLPADLGGAYDGGTPMVFYVTESPR